VAKLPVKDLMQEVETGLQNEQHRLNDAAMGQAFYDYEGKRFMQVFLRDAETPFDYVQRPYRASGLTRQLIEILTEHLYSPGPSRTWSDPAGDEALQRVYQDNHIDALMLRADQLSTLNDAAAVQIDAGEGDWAQKPATLRLWGADEFHVWSEPGNRTVPGAVCTIDRYDLRTTFRLWTREKVYTFETKKSELMMGGRTAKLVGTEVNTYGCLPFFFTHFELPVRRFWEPGIGDLLVQGEIRVNDRLSRLDESINKHLNPVAIAENVEDNFQLILESQRFIKLNHAKMRVGPSGGYEDGPEPKLYYLQANIDSASAWDDLLKYTNQLLEATHTPASAVRMEQEGVQSGIALIVEQAPLLTRARKRRGPYGIYETDGARTILTCLGNHYRRPKLVRSAQTGNLILGWPAPSVPVPTNDWFELELAKIAAGTKSLIMTIQEIYGVTRDHALQILRQIRADQDEAKGIVPESVLFARPEAPDEEQPDPSGAEDTDGGQAPDRVRAADQDPQRGQINQEIADL